MSDEQKDDLMDEIGRLERQIRTLKKEKSDTISRIDNEIEQHNNNLNKLKVQIIRFNQDRD